MDPIVTYIPANSGLHYSYSVSMFGWNIPVCFEDDEFLAQEMRSFGHLQGVLRHFHDHMEAGDLKGCYSFKYGSGVSHEISLRRLLANGHPDQDLKRFWQLHS
jgi:hypothetical protein